MAEQRTYNPCDECPYGIEKRDGSGNDSMCKICEFKALQNCTTPANPPLTLEQLREMDGIPIWVECTSDPKFSCWGIVNKEATFGHLCTFDYERYGKTWIAYFHKFEKEE